MIPKIKRRYDYGSLIFILTFSLVVVSGVRADKVMALARERLSKIGMGFFVCLFTNVLVYPMWASDELHDSTASKFRKLADCIEGNLTHSRYRYFVCYETLELIAKDSLLLDTYRSYYTTIIKSQNNILQLLMYDLLCSS
ncbi:hypothetical protein POM88_037207 [Heracleum sosnowskyi]|uniref:Uncharacterized protein n=1 Tax=Heracleum sosnowskyi TaxID=360622 RepID=A0AAD8MD36_9APIA|nr:hypothetical protein POM88_037207 [Heracleum sosnowskyi]